MASKLRYFTVTYTHQKMKKRKTFKDGLLTVDLEARKITLYDDCHKVIDSEHASTARNVNVGDEFEMEKFLVVVDNEDRPGGAGAAPKPEQPAAALVPRRAGLTKVKRPRGNHAAPPNKRAKDFRVPLLNGPNTGTPTGQPQEHWRGTENDASPLPEGPSSRNGYFPFDAASEAPPPPPRARVQFRTPPRRPTVGVPARHAADVATAATVLLGPPRARSDLDLLAWLDGAPLAETTPAIPTARLSPARAMRPRAAPLLADSISEQDAWPVTAETGGALSDGELDAMLAAIEADTMLEMGLSPAREVQANAVARRLGRGGGNGFQPPASFAAPNSLDDSDVTRLPFESTRPSRDGGSASRWARFGKGAPGPAEDLDATGAASSLASQANRFLRRQHQGPSGSRSPPQQKVVATATVASSDSDPAKRGATTRPAAGTDRRKPPRLASATNLKELEFPSPRTATASALQGRQEEIAITFPHVAAYKKALLDVLMEHLNDMLRELGQTYHRMLSGLDTSELSAEGAKQAHAAVPHCTHGPTRMATVQKEGRNKGRVFYACAKGRGKDNCDFFKWADEIGPEQPGVKGQSCRKVAVRTYKQLEDVCRGRDIELYAGCTMHAKGRDGPAFNGGKEFMLVLTNKRKVAYAKGDIWVVSSSLNFERDCTMVAVSTFFGPTSECALGVKAMSSFSGRRLLDANILFAIRAFNSAGELNCIDNVKEHIHPASFPLLPALLSRQPQTRRGQVLHMQPSNDMASLLLDRGEVEEVAQAYAAKHNLNDDQKAVLLAMAASIPAADDAESTEYACVSLVHGVFGSGKSFLIAVILCFLHDIFERSDALRTLDTDGASEWRILVSSTTNVAVDRILQGLLGLGFEKFCRVGSARKIAKSILPYSTHGTSNADKTELRDLRAMLKTQLTKQERASVMQTIEKINQGRDSAAQLSSARIVGATCAASTFPCLDKQSFPIVVLDECCQMTEPNALLPIARFDCAHLMLVGDPKQLDPTVAGSRAAHEQGLEQTLFHRLQRMDHPCVMLRTQYRCHPDIGEVANRVVYGNQLQHGTPAEKRPALVSHWAPLRLLDTAAGAEEGAAGGSYCNPYEARLAAKLVHFVCAYGHVNASQVGVIALYKAQATQIREALRDYAGATSSFDQQAVQISTVDAFQGGEKDIVIVSCVRTAATGFIDDLGRTNVAVTRARHHLLILGNVNCLRSSPAWREVVSICHLRRGGLCDARDYEALIDEAMLATSYLSSPSTASPEQKGEVAEEGAVQVDESDKASSTRPSARGSQVDQSDNITPTAADNDAASGAKKRLPPRGSRFELDLNDLAESSQELGSEDSDLPSAF